MSQLTLGQKIASRRKMIGLSQENLAEKLDVSRQAVSKWESDGAVPEVDKLISLSKLFEVSIGWLLGVEAEPTTPTAFTDDQLKTVEELIDRYHPPKQRSWWKYLVCTVTLIAIVFAFVYYNRQIHMLQDSNQQAIDQISSLSENNGALESQLEALSNDNDTLQYKLDSMNQLMNQQLENDRLLTDFFRLDAYADDNLENVTTTLYMRPKVYLPENKAMLSIQNPISGYSATIICNWSDANQVYIARYTIPADDGYKISFILYGEDGFQEENLVARDPGFAYCGTYCTFYTDPSFSFTPISIYIDEYGDIPDYVFTVPIYSPHIFAKTAVAYKDIRIIMEHNGRIIWEQSYLDEFYLAAGGVYLNAGDTPVEPNIRVPIPMAEIGDELELYLVAETVNGGAKTQSYYTLLQKVHIRDIKELDLNN